MGKHKLQKHHLYLGFGGMLAVTALVVALTFGLSSAEDACPTDQFHCVSLNNQCSTKSACDEADAARGGNNTQPTQVTCQNGTQAATQDQCPKCSDGTFTPMGGCPVKCPNGSNAPENDTSKCAKCADGVTTIPVDGVCPRTQTNTTDVSTDPKTRCEGDGKLWCAGPNGGGFCEYNKSTCPNTSGIAGGVMTKTECENQSGYWQTGTNGAQSWCKFSDSNTATQTNMQCGQGMHYAQGMGCVRDMTPEEIKNQYQKQPYVDNSDDSRTTGSCIDQYGKNMLSPGQWMTVKDCTAKGGKTDLYGKGTQPQYQKQPYQQDQKMPYKQDQGDYRPAGDQGQQYQNQQPMYGIFGPQPMMGGQGQNGPQNEEQMQKQQADQEAQFKKMQEQQVKQIKKELSRMKKEVDRVRKQLDKVTVTDNTPEEIVTAKEALAEIDAAMAEVDTCSADDCFDIMPTVGPLMQDIMNPDVQNALQRLKEGPKFVKKLTTEVNRMVKKSTSAATFLSKKAKKINDVDVRDEVIAEIATVAEQCSTLGAEVLDVAKGGDIETAADSLQNELSDACGGVEELTWKVEGFLNKSKSIKFMGGEVKSLKRQLAKFQKDAQRGKFNGDLDAVSSLAVAIPDVEALLAEIKTEKDIDMLGDLFDEAAGLIFDAKGFIEDAQIENMANQFDMFYTAPKGESVGESNPQPSP